MTLPLRIIVFILANLFGFVSVHICYLLGVWSGIISADNPAFDPEAFRSRFVAGTMLTWVVCAVFSLSFFFLKERAGWLFLMAPAVIPMGYGLSVIAGLFPAG